MWNLLCKEHGLTDSGYRIRSNPPRDDRHLTTMFEQLTPEKYYARAVFVNDDPNSIENAQNGPHRDLYKSDSFVVGSTNAEGLYPKGYDYLGREVTPAVMEKIRKLAENCDNPQGFLTTHAMGGGAGGGATARLLQGIKQEYHKTPQAQLAVFPEARLDSPGSLFGVNNLALFLKDTMSDLRNIVLTNNDALLNSLVSCALQEIARENNSRNEKINKILAHVASAMTCLTRFPGDCKSNMSDMERQLVPTRLMRFNTPSFTPFTKGCNCHGNPETMSIADITRGCLSQSQQLFTSNPSCYPIVSSSIQYRGDPSKNEINAALGNAVREYDMKFVNGMPEGFNVAVAKDAPTMIPFDVQRRIPHSAAMFNNSPAIVPSFEFIKHAIEEILKRKLILHYFKEFGTEESEFCEALENLSDVINEYKRCR